MRTWTATATADAHPAAILSVLTDADVNGLAREIREAISQPKWARTGEAGRGHKAPMTATGPVGFDVDYRLAPTARGSEVHASISVRPNGGLAGRLLAEATSVLLNAGALDQTLARLTRAAATA